MKTAVITAKISIHILVQDVINPFPTNQIRGFLAAGENSGWIPISPVNYKIGN